jgi:ankyrin repeat protein
MPRTSRLHKAAQKGKVKTVQALLAVDGDTERRDADGATALLLACREMHLHGNQ